MTILITGGAGFLGRLAAQHLLARADTQRVVLLDLTAAEGFDDPRVEAVAGDLDPTTLARLITPETSHILHLAAVVSGQAEADLDLGMRVNLDGTRAVLEAARHAGHCPRLVFASSVAVFGGALPPVVQDDTWPTPVNSYGAQKAMGELLVADYSRRGLVDGRSLRLPTVVVRPGKPNAAASSFASGIIREPLAGELADCPVAPETKLWVSSPATVVANLIRALEVDADHWGARTAVNLPGLTVSVAEMLDALATLGGQAARARVTLTNDPRIRAIVQSWPGAFATTRADALGFGRDPSMTAIVEQYIAHHPDAVRI